MKHHLKNYLKLGILLFGISFLLVNCQLDDDISVQSQNNIITNSKYKISKINLNQIKDKGHLTTDNSNKKTVKRKNNNLKTYTSSYDFVIDTDFVTYIETTDGLYHSYTFPIINKVETDSLKNLLISLQPDNTYSAFIVNYSTTAQEKQDLENNIPVDLSNKVSYNSIEDEDFVKAILSDKGLSTEITNKSFYETDCLQFTFLIGPCDLGFTYFHPPEQAAGGGMCSGSSYTLIGAIPNLECIEDFNTSGDGTSGTSGTENNNPGGTTNSGNPDTTTATTCPECPDYYAAIQKQLNKDLEENPFKLIEIDCDQIQHWLVLAQNTASQNIQDKINSLPSSFSNNFEIQSLSDANGTIVNMDYFPVNISVLPDNPITGQQFSADEFLDYFRRNINDFVDGGGSSFSPYCQIASMCQQETDLWNSNNPTGSIIYLDIPSDDGVIICSEFQNDYWFFMTMNAPYAGNHPVSGTRQFGYEQNTDGSYNFFVRGVDRFNSLILSSLAELFADVDPFIAADFLWYNFQENMNNFVNENNGSSNIPEASLNRVNWDDVKDVLLGEKPISELGCE